MALIAAPIAAVLAGTLEFVILDGATEFPLLAIALAPFMVGATVLMTRPNPMLSALGRLNLIFILGILSPSNTTRKRTCLPHCLFVSRPLCCCRRSFLSVQSPASVANGGSCIGPPRPRSRPVS
jgi:hypothetical protein